MDMDIDIDMDMIWIWLAPGVVPGDASVLSWLSCQSILVRSGAETSAVRRQNGDE